MKRLLRPRGLLILMAALYVALSGALAAFFVWTDRTESIRKIEGATADVARLLEEHANRTLDAAELAMMRIVDHGPDLIASRKAAIDLLSKTLDTSPHLSNIYVLDNMGRMVLDFRGVNPPGTSFADKDWAKAVKAGTDKGTYVGQAWFDDTTRNVVFTLAHPLTDAKGAFAGIVGITVPVDYFKEFYRKLDYGPVPALGLYRMDGAVLVRQPIKAEDIGRNMAGNPIYTQHLPKSPIGTYQGRSAVDGVTRIVSYRKADPRQLVVWVSVGASEALAAWHGRSLRVGGLLLVSWVLMGALAWLLYRELMREHRIAEALESANRDLQRSNTDLEQFAYIASHDLKEPLRNIASYVQLLQRRYQGQLDADADAFIGYTVEGVQRMQTIISELLSYSRIGTGELALVPVQAGILVSTALAHLKGVIAETQSVIEIEGQLPVIEGDAALLGSLFQNLIGNALKYRRDDVRPMIQIGCQDRGSTWEFHVTDNGIGIEQEYLGQIFDLFRRLHPRDRYSGTGIGLAICQRVVERHGGRIWCESLPGQGSSFRFTIPKQI
jgi:signal transduction histidine kinase